MFTTLKLSELNQVDINTLIEIRNAEINNIMKNEFLPPFITGRINILNEEIKTLQSYLK